MSDEMSTQRVIAIPTKSVGISLLLTFIFGSVGLFYSTVLGAIIMLIIEAIIGFMTFGFGLIFTHPICMIWGAIAVNSYNKKLLAGKAI